MPVTTRSHADKYYYKLEELPPLKKRRRRRRRQKKWLHHEENRQCSSNLLLPKEVWLYIFEFSAPNELNPCRWTWCRRIRQVSIQFRQLVDEYMKPMALELDFANTATPHGPESIDDLDSKPMKNFSKFLRSFTRFSWMNKNISYILMNNVGTNHHGTTTTTTMQEGCWKDVKFALQELLTCRDSFPSVTKIGIMFLSKDDNDPDDNDDKNDLNLFDSNQVLFNFAQAHGSKLDYLYLDGCFSKTKFTCWQSIFSVYLTNLETLILGGVEQMNDIVISQCCSNWKNLSFLCFDTCGEQSEDEQEQTNRITDVALMNISKYCIHLKEVALKNLPFITNFGLELLLRKNPMVQGLDLSATAQISADIIPSIRKFTPNLKNLNMQYNVWFTNDCLLELFAITTMKENDRTMSTTTTTNTTTTTTSSNTTTTPILFPMLDTLNIEVTHVTPAGVRQVLEHNPQAFCGTKLDVGYGIQDLCDPTILRPGIPYQDVSEMLIPENFEDLRSSMEERKRNWYQLAQEYNLCFHTRRRGGKN